MMEMKLFHQQAEETMSQITTIGLDTSKQVFHLVGLNRAGKVVHRKMLRRHQVLRYFARMPPTVIGMETCGGSHYWGRELGKLGHTIRLVPARDVRVLRRGQKNDYNDALAIAEAIRRPAQRFVSVKGVSDHDFQLLQRLRRGYLNARTRQANRMRGLLAEYGLVIPKGLTAVRRRVPELLEDPDTDLSAVVRSLLHQAWQHLQQLDEQIEECNRQMNEQLKPDELAQRLLATPGFGPVVTSCWRAKIGDGRQFRRGRDVAAAIGLVPRQHTTGGRPQLLGITKSGDKELRSLLIHGARSVVIHAHKKTDPLSRWVCQVKDWRGTHKATVALANKLARIAWAMSVHATEYQPKLAS